MKWFLIAAGLLAAYWLFWLPAPPIFYRGRRQVDLPPFLRSLFRNMATGSVLHLQHEDSARRLRLRKLYRPDGRQGARLELPDGAEARAEIGAVEAALQAAGFAVVHSAPTERHWLAQHPQAILAVEHLDVLSAFRAVEVARGGLGLDQDARFTMYYEGPPSFKAVREYHAEREGSSPA